MTFDEFCDEVAKLGFLPDMAIANMPMSFSEKAKKKLVKDGSQKSAEILKSTIEDINHRNTESVDEIVNSKFKFA